MQINDNVKLYVNLNTASSAQSQTDAVTTNATDPIEVKSANATLQSDKLSLSAESLALLNADTEEEPTNSPGPGGAQPNSSGGTTLPPLPPVKPS